MSYGCLGRGVGIHTQRWVTGTHLDGNVQHEPRLSGMGHTHDADTVRVANAHLLYRNKDMTLREQTASPESETTSPPLASPYRT